ncbi:transporter substrate-binding domain-containing protein [Desulfospira joergensenii]|uniref:transporter substrate-binding domain-containing protein n=1 Tax=Desulfospira joergensenii TaxID=53329 RepID=UPI0003B6E33A|nr:transporter substrate-binding domain-containing protein [Desulfospira joergensenii]
MKIRSAKQVFWIVLFFLWTVPVHAESPKTLVFVTSDAASNVVNAYHEFLKLAYGEIGYDVRMVRFPVKRSYIHADIEKADGILVSTKNLLEGYKNMLAVPVPLRQVELVVYSASREFIVDGVASLKPYRIGFMRGYFLSEEMTRDMDRIIVDTYDALFTILDIGRVDLVLALRGETERFLNRNTQFQGFKALEPPLFRVSMYHFLNRKHKALIPAITPVLERLIREKVLERLYAPYTE